MSSMYLRRTTCGLALALLTVSALGCGRHNGQPADERGGDAVELQFYRDPDAVKPFTAADLEGRALSSADLKGKVTIVNFWATWCPPCRQEIPDLIALQDKYRDQLQIIGVSEDDDPPSKVKQFVADHKMNYRIVMTTNEIHKVFGNVDALPTSFVIDREGRIVQKHVGMLRPDTTEAETRSLAGLPVNASIETIDKDQPPPPVKLANAAQTTNIPGVDLAALPKDKRVEAIQKLNDEGCTCGCNLTVARCRVDDPKCPVSLPRAQEIIGGIQKS